MKSYLRFLGRNKLYTAIEVVGLSVSLAFLIILGSYVLQDLNCNKSIKNLEEVHILRNKQIMNEFLVRHDMTSEQVSHIPGIKDMCQYLYETENFGRQVFTAKYQDDEYILNSLMATDRNFFDFFSLPLSIGDPHDILVNMNGAVISERISKAIFGDRNPIGEKLSVQFTFSADYSLFEFVIEGVFPEFPSIAVREPDIVIRMDNYSHIQASVFQDIQNQEIPRIQFIRIEPAGDMEITRNGLNDAYSNAAGDNDFYDIEIVSLTDFYRKEAFEENRGSAYCNYRNTDTFYIYLFICILLACLSLINYILLTIAYSHFRIKEIATRQLLGTERSAIITRCILEAMFLIVISMIFAGLISLGAKNLFSNLLNIEIDPLKTLPEYILLAVSAAAMALPAGLASSLALTKYSPIDIIKGQKRMKEKSILSKLFIGFEGCLAISSTTLLLTVTMQIIFLLNYPMGYETDNLIYIEYKSQMPRHTDELQSLPFVENLGMIGNTPMSCYVTFPKGGNVIGYVEAQRCSFDMMGITISDYGEPDDNPYGLGIYLSDESMDAIPGAIENREWLIYESGRKKEISGTCSQFRLGTMKKSSINLCAAYIIPDRSPSINNDILVKVIGDENKACREIEKMYEDLGYDFRSISVKSFNQYHEEDFKEERSMQNLLLAFVLTCLLMTAMAIAAFSSYYTQLQTHDTAVRKVFGISRREVFWKTVWGFLLPILTSAVVAIPATYFMVTKWLENYTLRIDNSWTIYAAGLAIVLAVTLSAVAFQALRLVRTNPAEALKKE